MHPDCCSVCYYPYPCLCHINKPMINKPSISISVYDQDAISGVGYHKKDIAKGVLGEISKIQEELNELADALEQDCSIMALVELSDLYGSIEAFLTKHFPNTTMKDLETMAKITKRAFDSGERK